jgi:hypothetical protein
MENTRNIANIVLIFRICGVKVPKIHAEREGGVGGRWVMPFGSGHSNVAQSETERGLKFQA